MGIELNAMLAVGFLYWALAQVAAGGKIAVAGLAWGIGNRETEPQFPGWVQRCERAHRNLGESLPLFFALVVATLATRHSCGWTQLGALLFVIGRLGHAATFLVGVTGWRTLAYQLSLIGMGLMAFGVFHLI